MEVSHNSQNLRIFSYHLNEILGVLEESDGFSSDDDVPVPPPKASRKSAAQKNPSSREREYIPARRSGI